MISRQHAQKDNATTTTYAWDSWMDCLKCGLFSYNQADKLMDGPFTWVTFLAWPHNSNNAFCCPPSNTHTAIQKTYIFKGHCHIAWYIVIHFICIVRGIWMMISCLNWIPFYRNTRVPRPWSASSVPIKREWQNWEYFYMEMKFVWNSAKVLSINILFFYNGLLQCANDWRQNV